MLTNRRDLTLVYLKADNEEKLQTALFELELTTSKMPDVIAIYPKGSSVIAWLRLDSKFVEVKAEKPKKKKQG